MHDDVVVRGEEHLIDALDLLEHRRGLGRELGELVLPGRETARSPCVDAIAPDAPEEAHEPRPECRPRTVPGREHAEEALVAVDHLMKRAGARRVGIARVFADEPKRAPRVRRDALARAGVVAELRARTVGHDDELVRAMTLTVRVDEPARASARRARSREIDDLDAVTHRDALLAGHRGEERLEEDAAMEPDPEEIVGDARIGEIDE